jgi:hypothetical protein
VSVAALKRAGSPTRILRHHESRAQRVMPGRYIRLGDDDVRDQMRAVGRPLQRCGGVVLQAADADLTRCGADCERE